MKEYSVTIYETFRHNLVIEADNENSALEEAYEFLSSGNKEGVTTEAVEFNGHHEVREW